MTIWSGDDGETLTILAHGGAVRLEMKTPQGQLINLNMAVAMAEQLRDELTRAIDFAKGPPVPPAKPEIPER